MDRTRRIAAIGAAIALVAVVAIVGTRLVVADDDTPAADGVDVGFLRDMIDHHEQANLMALIVLDADATLAADNLAVDVLVSQRYEIGLMEGWLTEWGFERGAVGRDAMAWMGMHARPAEMPGMASQEQLNALAERSGAALDAELFELMIAHHEGGIHMAEAAAGSATNSHVRWLAGTIVRNQQREIREIETMISMLGSGATVSGSTSSR